MDKQMNNVYEYNISVFKLMLVSYLYVISCCDQKQEALNLFGF
jgi:hypothetical protein